MAKSTLNSAECKKSGCLGRRAVSGVTTWTLAACASPRCKSAHGSAWRARPPAGNSKQRRSAKRFAEHHAKLRGDNVDDAAQGAGADTRGSGGTAVEGDGSLAIVVDGAVANAARTYQQQVEESVAAEVAAAAKRARSPLPAH